MADIRVKKTKNNLRRAMIKILEIYSYEELTVDMLCKEAMSSRSTFYQYYSNKKEILVELISDILNDIKKNSIAKFERTIPTEIAIRDIRKYLIERKTLIKSLLNADIGEDSFKTSLRNLYKEIFLKYYTNISSANMLSEYFSSIVETSMNLLLNDILSEEDMKIFNILEKELFSLSVFKTKNEIQVNSIKCKKKFKDCLSLDKL